MATLRHSLDSLPPQNVDVGDAKEAKSFSEAIHSAENKLTTRRSVLVHLALLAAQLCWGFLNVFGGASLEVVPWTQLLIIRMLVCGLIYLAMGAVLERHKWPLLYPAWRWNFKVIIFASIYRGIGLGLYFLGLTFTTAINASVLQVTIPVFVVLFCIIFRGENKSVLKFIGVILAIGFSVGLISVEKFSLASFGDAIIVLMSISFAGWLTWVGPFTEHIPPFSFNALTFIVASIIFAPSMLFHKDRLIPPSSFSLDLWFSLIIMIFIGTVAFQILEYWAVVQSSPVLTSAYSPMQMVFTLIIEWMYHGVVPSLRQGVCSTGVVLGLGLVSYVKWRETVLQPDDRDSLNETQLSNSDRSKLIELRIENASADTSSAEDAEIEGRTTKSW